MTSVEIGKYADRCVSEVDGKMAETFDAAAAGWKFLFLYIYVLRWLPLLQLPIYQAIP